MPNQQEYTGKVEKKLLPDSLAGKSYKKNNMKVEWIVIHNTDGANKVSSPYNHFSQGASKCLNLLSLPSRISQLLTLMK